ncbi:hypothetical protein PIB30_073262 [Stylosanthes scabra]|uniref:Uncharacterized protein n=1 Tax=Stylosanthes scabra TaxID=79078 RepID=A0ABU6RPQ7_9FABA|nr:hypothetical protein [Stylosanthes scabra]
MIDASSGGALMNKTPKEAWELIKMWPMPTKILTERPPVRVYMSVNPTARSRNRLSIVRFALATPTILTNVRNYKRITQWRQLTTSLMPLQFRPTTSNITLKEGTMVNLLGTQLSSHKLSLGSLIPTAPKQPESKISTPT